MAGKPQLLLHHLKKKPPRVSVILIDWGVRESFHSLHYLEQQTVSRDDYELIWLEFYDRQPQGLRDMLARSSGAPRLDKWIVLGYPDHYCFHKHRLYNLGILLSSGDICVICDSDAIYQPTFIASILRAFEQTPRAVVHLDEVRTLSQEFYPFNYPSLEQIRGPGCMNWRGTITQGLDNSKDMLHDANYGACMAARRQDLLAIGGADEHLDYIGYICGPYEMTFRLANHGRPERWLTDEYLYHTWHPNQSGWNTDYKGPTDGRSMSLLAMEAQATGRVKPLVKSPWMEKRWWRPGRPEPLLEEVRRRAEPTWERDRLPPPCTKSVYWIEKNYYGFDIFCHQGTFHAIHTGQGWLDMARLQRGGYEGFWQARYQFELRDILPIDFEKWHYLHSGSALRQLWRKFRAQPLHHLPYRMARKTSRLIRSRL